MRNWTNSGETVGGFGGAAKPSTSMAAKDKARLGEASVFFSSDTGRVGATKELERVREGAKVGVRDGPRPVVETAGSGEFGAARWCSRGLLRDAG